MPTNKMDEIREDTDINLSVFHPYFKALLEDYETELFPQAHILAAQTVNDNNRLCTQVADLADTPDSQQMLKSLHFVTRRFAEFKMPPTPTLGERLPAFYAVNGGDTGKERNFHYSSRLSSGAEVRGAVGARVIKDNPTADIVSVGPDISMSTLARQYILLLAANTISAIDKDHNKRYSRFFQTFLSNLFHYVFFSYYPDYSTKPKRRILLLDGHRIRSAHVDLRLFLTVLQSPLIGTILLDQLRRCFTHHDGEGLVIAQRAYKYKQTLKSAADEDSDYRHSQPPESKHEGRFAPGSSSGNNADTEHTSYSSTIGSITSDPEQSHIPKPEGELQELDAEQNDFISQLFYTFKGNAVDIGYRARLINMKDFTTFFLDHDDAEQPDFVKVARDDLYQYVSLGTPERQYTLLSSLIVMCYRDNVSFKDTLVLIKRNSSLIFKEESNNSEWLFDIDAIKEESVECYTELLHLIHTNKQIEKLSRSTESVNVEREPPSYITDMPASMSRSRQLAAAFDKSLSSLFTNGEVESIEELSPCFIAPTKENTCSSLENESTPLIIDTSAGPKEPQYKIILAKIQHEIDEKTIILLDLKLKTINSRHHEFSSSRFQSVGAESIKELMQSLSSHLNKDSSSSKSELSRYASEGLKELLIALKIIDSNKGKPEKQAAIQAFYKKLRSSPDGWTKYGRVITTVVGSLLAICGIVALAITGVGIIPAALAVTSYVSAGSCATVGIGLFAARFKRTELEKSVAKTKNALVDASLWQPQA